MKKGGFYKQFTMNKTIPYPFSFDSQEQKESIKEFIEQMWWLFVRHIFYMDKGANDMFSVISWKRF